MKVFENRVPRRMCGLKRHKLTRGRMKLYEELQNLCYSPSVIRTVKSRRLRLEAQVASMRANRNASRKFVGMSKEATRKT
jgi:hypothetical protein